ncbi:uncharacterized protein A4U43_C01F15510 [Asparagus officinalis]|uniref:Uncharacterized protein n=1 Tax=Asparagus officinalis TaxID=4686 RepID=A0A5P1FPK7_ASPOF|nr:uncharacterized protein LOC109823734 [Asparagus officinalis]ONK80246.1 uncharacterized protein A4U43_C01F15510 [Asparagus officinalis]
MAFGSLSLISSSSNPIPNPSPSPSSAFHGAQRPPRSLPFRALRRPRAISASIEERDDGIDQFSESNSISDFMRFKKGEGVGRGGEGTGELQTAVVSYKKRFPWVLLQPFLQVDLVSTIHIADKEYFDTLQKELQLYDCVLYEMVASRESLENRKNSTTTRRLKASRSKGFNILGFIQRQMARILALDFQLDCLNYQADNWLHADLDFETFKMLQLERGESLFTFARDMTIRSTKALVQTASIPEDLGPWRSKLLWMSRVLPMPLVGLLIIGSVCAPAEKQPAEYPELEALSRLDVGAALKIFLAKRLTSEFTQMTASVEEKSVIIGERNRVATEALQRAIENGSKRIAVLYGGGHMPDLGRRLKEEFDLVPSQVQWITAWSIRNRELDNRSFPFLKNLAEISGWPLNRYQTLALFIFSSVLAVDLWFWELFFGTVVNWASWAAAEVNIFTVNMRIM